MSLIDTVLAALNIPSKRSLIHQFPDRRLLADVYLPAFAEGGGRILFVGVRRYTADYYRLLERKGAEVWTTDIETKVARFGRKGRHRTGDICQADQLFAGMTFDAVLFNGILGYGVDSENQQKQALEALSRILKPGGRLLVGWNTDKIADPVESGVIAPWFTPAPFAGQPSRVRFDDATHVYDSLTRL